MRQDFIVYCHLKADIGEVFYVGKGTMRRMKVSNGRSKFWKNIVRKHGIKYQIIASNLYEHEALNFEKTLIKCLRDSGSSLCNLTDGGDGVSGYKHTNETRLLLSEINKGSTSYWKGKQMSAEHVKKISESRKGKKLSPEHIAKVAASKIGKKLSQETKDKIRAKVTGFKHTKETRLKMSVPVFCLTNNKYYDSVTDAANELNLSTSNISKVCKGKLNHTGGFVFKYITENNTTE